jgi:divalent metal cation (Fe/Co/Zn/Cd) transporter
MENLYKKSLWFEYITDIYNTLEAFFSIVFGSIFGRKICSKALVGDSKKTITCAFLSVLLFLGLVLNYIFGFWQLAPIVGMIIMIFLVKEGIEIINESYKY